MKRIGILIITLISSAASFFAPAASAQTIPEGYEMVDSIIYRPVAAVDSTLAGKDVFDLLHSKKAGDEADVNIDQSSEILGSMRQHMVSNAKRTLSGYRVRIFFDNKQSARTESEKTLRQFRELYPGVTAYHIYANPYFKVTVGDFRTKSEAMALLTRIKGAFPSAFVVRENIEYPVFDSDNAVIADTVKVLRPVQ